MNNVFQELEKIGLELKAQEDAAGKTDIEIAAETAELERIEAERIAAENLISDNEDKTVEEIEAERLEVERVEVERIAAEKLITDKEETWKEVALRKKDAKQKEVEIQNNKETAEHPLVKRLISDIQKGKTVKETLTTYLALQETNPSEFTEEQIFATTLDAGTNQEDADDAFYKFNSLPESTRNRIIESQKKELESSYNKIQEELSHNPLAAHVDGLIKAKDSIWDLTGELIGTEDAGVKITNTIAEKVYETADRLLVAYGDGKGNYDTKQALKDAVILTNHKIMEEIAAEKGRNVATKKAYEQINRPAAELPKGTIKTERSKIDKEADALEAHLVKGTRLEKQLT